MRLARGSAATTTLLFAIACGGESVNEVPRDDASATSSSSSASSTGESPASPAIQIRASGSPEPIERALWGEAFEVHLSGMPKGASVTLRGKLPTFASEAVFVIDDDGAVDTASVAPTSGTYEGVDPDGIVWSMVRTEPPPAQPPDSSVIEFDAELDGQVVASASLTRYRQADGVEQIPIDDPAIVGVFYVPPGPGPHPAMMVFGGSEGGLSYGASLAPYLASFGYATLGLAYFGAEGVPENLINVPLEYFGNALTWLAAQGEVDPEHIGVMGASRGGELALLLGATFPAVKSVVAMVPSGLVWPGSDGFFFGPAWTFQGQGVPYMPSAGDHGEEITGPDGETLLASRPTFEAAVAEATPEELDAATTDVELTNGPILMLAGDDDQLWPSCPLAAVAEDRLAGGHSRAHADELVCYPDAGHIFGFPGMPTTEIYKVYHPVYKIWFAVGGTPLGSAKAQRDVLDRVRVFLKESLTN